MKSYLCILLFGFHISNAQSATSFNDNWEFVKGVDTLNRTWSAVQIPHTWNVKDPFDKEAGYYRGVSWYRKQFHISEENKRHFLTFEAVNQEAEVFINGILAGSHLGGYTAFNVEITEFVTSGNNRIDIKVSNQHDESIPPLKGDFNFYGGIYRDIWLHTLEDVHFELSQYGDQGIFITTPEVSPQKATLRIKTNISNQSDVKCRIKLIHSLYDNTDQLVAKSSKKLSLKAGITSQELNFPEIVNPDLWHPDSPVLYRLTSEIRTQDGTLLDIQVNSVGFRWFRFDANEGFFLNGEYLKLMGTNRHQDFEGLGNALSDDRHQTDVADIKNMGSNFFRTAHYPQDPSVLEAADRLGLVVSMEIPLDHEITDSEAFLTNSKRMMQEMIRQNFNHPSVFIWAYMNEMMLGRKWERDKEQIEKIRRQALELEKLTKREDPTRYTMIPNHGALDLYINAGLTDIPMIVGWNLYFGWYESDGEGAGKFLDRFHELVPNKPVLITEYGAGADPRIRSLIPERFDFSIEWQNQFHQSNLIQFSARKFLAGAAIWNIADFGSETRNDADPKINSKGVIEMDRTPKDAYYLYQAWLRDDPVLKIGSSNWDNRVIRQKGGATPSHGVEVYSNANEVELFLNQKSLGKKKVEDHIALWDVVFEDHKNILEARGSFNGKEVSDRSEVVVQLIKPHEVDWGEGIHINCGSTFYFLDRINGINWIPDFSYEEGLWGYIGGEIYRPRDRGVGSDRTILNTQNDPIYQTARTLESRYKFDVSLGTYEIIFHWAETNKDFTEEDRKRTFDVLINEQKVFAELNVQEEFGFSTAVSRKIKYNIQEGPLIIEFSQVIDIPMVSGIQIRKLN